MLLHIKVWDPLLWLAGKKYTRTKPVPNIIKTVFILVSSFTTMIAIDAVLRYGPVFRTRNSPPIPPWAATIILTNNYLESPFGQPFAVFFGTIISSVIGVGLTKLFMLNPANEAHLWVCGALAATIASVVMSNTHTLHPAAASTALITAIDPGIRQLGWYYLVNQIVCGVIVIFLACLFGNMYARYPLYWVLPPKLEALPKKTQRSSLSKTTTRSKNVRPVSSRGTASPASDRTLVSQN